MNNDISVGQPSSISIRKILLLCQQRLSGQNTFCLMQHKSTVAGEYIERRADSWMHRIISVGQNLLNSSPTYQWKPGQYKSACSEPSPAEVWATHPGDHSTTLGPYGSTQLFITSITAMKIYVPLSLRAETRNSEIIAYCNTKGGKKSLQQNHCLSSWASKCSASQAEWRPQTDFTVHEELSAAAATSLSDLIIFWLVAGVGKLKSYDSRLPTSKKKNLWCSPYCSPGPEIFRILANAQCPKGSWLYEQFFLRCIWKTSKSDLVHKIKEKIIGHELHWLLGGRKNMRGKATPFLFLK